MLCLPRSSVSPRFPALASLSPAPKPNMWLDADSALRHLDRLQAAALALCGNRPDADDLVQETYLTLLRRPRKLTGGSELAYLMTMLRNRHIDRMRTLARRGTRVPL